MDSVGSNPDAASAAPPVAAKPPKLAPTHLRPGNASGWRIAGGILSVLSLTAMALFWFPPEEYAFYPRCLFNSMTGLQCPGCGGLRAASQLLHGHLLAAIRLNALAVLLVPFGMLWLAGFVFSQGSGRDNLRWFRGRYWGWIFLGLALVFTLIRNLPLSAER